MILLAVARLDDDAYGMAILDGLQARTGAEAAVASVYAALGAEVRTVRWMVVSEGVRLLTLGIGVGLIAVFTISRLLGNLVFEVSATDPLTFIRVPLVLPGVAPVVNLVPATKATRLDPADTLRTD